MSPDTERMIMWPARLHPIDVQAGTHLRTRISRIMLDQAGPGWPFELQSTIYSELHEAFSPRRVA